MREPDVIQAEMDAKKAAGVHAASKEMRDLREELRAAQAPLSPSAPPAPADASPPAVPAAAVRASDDVAFISDALAQVLKNGKVPSPERVYSDLRSLIRAKHILEDAAGLVPTGRISLPHWDTLGRDRDSGEKFKPGENQLIVDGLAQRAIPAPKGATRATRIDVTAPDGSPLILPRTRINEPDGAAQFVTQEAGGEE